VVRAGAALKPPLRSAEARTEPDAADHPHKRALAPRLTARTPVAPIIRALYSRRAALTSA
jgi:hypothetical protein